ncbi:alpha-2-macroglobulin [Ottowia sp. GY511]|uniref:Alpha-2-macroglobulin n=1 Tax=Ottowia flava TaxID=2675430 RepID=A0ABW4KTQ8_9BURK|nr:MG2 domain-containing protein [Ottowia sp. GY511]TXK33321.1 alpha-2-macroglobulin [Ottowia sp. GY511]
MAFVFLLGASSASAFTTTSLTPQGEVASVRQVVAKFSDDVVKFGDPKAPAPFSVSCDNAEASKGQARWNSAREWVYDFAADLPPGVRCRVEPISGFKSASGAVLTSASSYQFNTGGPFVQRVTPSTSQPIEEDQVFVLRLNGAATTESLQNNLWCQVDGLGEQVPVRMVTGEPRTVLLKALHMQVEAEKAPGRYVTLSCNRRLTPASRVQLVYGRGVATPSGVINHVEKRYAFKVREPFTASMTCERENAQAACMPIRPITLRFSAPVPRRLAGEVRLRADKAEYRPVFDESLDADALVDEVRFPAPLPERTALKLSLPPDLKDASGRALANASGFPMSLATAPLPPLAKFAAAPFGVVERFAEGKNSTPLMPVTLRYVEPALAAQGLQIGRVQPQSDAEIIAWFTRVQRFDQFMVPRKVAAAEVRQMLPKPVSEPTEDYIEARSVSLLQGAPDVQRLALPPAPGGSERPFEVVGIPLTPGFHVVEIASQRLGSSLLDPKYGAQRTMYVRSSALVTNLGVHFKLGRENALAWVTTLDTGKPVAGAAVRVSTCAGKEVATATTDAKGIARFKGIAAQAPQCGQDGDYVGDFQQAYFVSARADNAGAQDMAFTWSSWQSGIEPWRFNVPTNRDDLPNLRAHTVFDRSLLRAGETVSMKHVLRTETSAGFGLPKASPATLVITHVGSGQEFTQPLAWRATASGGRSAESTMAIPPAAKLGVYQVSLRTPAPAQGEAGNDMPQEIATGQFRVEEFRLPVLQGSVGPQSKEPLVSASSVPTQVQVSYVSGGPAGALPVRVSALTRNKSVNFKDYDEFSFEPPRPADTPQGGDGEEESTAQEDQQVVADKLPLTLDRNGQGQLTIQGLKPSPRPRDLLIEATFADPNGEIQTLRGTRTLWPASVVPGIKAERWASTEQAAKLHAVALDLQGKPIAGVPLDVKAVARTTTTSRKRMVGGFYTYDNRTETKDLGTVCTGTSDARGLVVCDVKLAQAGEVELVVNARDAQGHAAQAATSVWVTQQGELWFGGENHDRMDVLAEKKSYEPGDTARFQVRMPFRQATALVAVEREGILHTEVVELRGDDPTVSLKVDPAWGPNVYVSVLALRGRLYDVPWYSFFTWGYKSPRAWWQAFWHDSKDFVAPTALVDLSKPAFRLGMAEIRIGTAQHALNVAVKADQERYPVRGKARVTVTVKRPDGQPAAGAEVALAAVDQALLELMPNRSWNLLEAMMQRRAWGVETATAQMEIVGRRHYGRKAVPTGGDGGGRSPTRELFDTLLLWQPHLKLDAQGSAVVEVPLNDSLTSFQIVAVADEGLGLFGTGQTTIRATQDLQIISGLPPLVREGDQFRAQLTLRNTTAKPMKVEVTPRASLIELAAQTVDIPAGEAREVQWDVTAPEQPVSGRVDALQWEVQARDTDSGVRDALKLSQRIVPAVPLTVRQATLVQLAAPYSLAVAAPADALPAGGAKRGGVQIALQPKLADGLPGVRDWFARYPYSCLEQTASKAIGLGDDQLWQRTTAQLPGYLDEDGLAYYFPPRGGETHQGSDTLTAWLLAATHEAAQLKPGFTLPDAARAQMLAGLASFVEGKIERKHWSPRDDLDVRKLAAIEALSRYGAARPGMLSSLTIAPNQWPTSALIDWMNILKRVQGIPNQRDQLSQAEQILRTRLTVQGTRLGFSTEKDDHWWWLMAGGDVNSARLLLTVMDNPAWKDELGRLVTGFIARQQNGAWNTTTANLWGGLALQQFSRQHESEPVTGSTRATLGSASADIDWAKVTRRTAADAQGAPASTRTGAPAGSDTLTNNRALLPWATGADATLAVTHTGTGKPWLTLQALAAVPLKAPFSAGYQIKKTVTAVEQANKQLPEGQYSRGDVLRVTLDVTGASDMTWVAVSDPIPAGATILGGGLGRDSTLATLGEKIGRTTLPAFEERSFEAFRAYYQYLPKGTAKLEYTVRLNNAGSFQLPPTRVEALYAPEMYGEAPNARLSVKLP